MVDPQNEMSSKIDVLEYHENEEKHAYFVEMMQSMIRKLPNCDATSAPCHVCEVGAGTGLFTGRLLRETTVQRVTALERDENSFDLLRTTVAPFGGRAKALMADVMTFSSGEQFDAIVSSFTDHHIRPSERDAYFANVRCNLVPNGVFIVGDEFLRPYTCRPEQEAALVAYHCHILEQARNLGAAGRTLLKIELAALRSGLEENFDFKVSCEEYEGALQRCGFEFTREKIGPLDRNDVGGVFVYCATPAGPKSRREKARHF